MNARHCFDAVPYERVPLQTVTLNKTMVNATHERHGSILLCNENVIETASRRHIVSDNYQPDHYSTVPWRAGRFPHQF